MTTNEQHPASLSIFISSTISEFRDLRSAIGYTLRAQGYIVYLSEAADFDVRGNRSAIEECFENIRKSDYYILLMGGARGSLFDARTSVTRQEYRVARDSYLSIGRPLIHLFLRDSVENALKGTEEERQKAGIDDSDHLALFIEEVQNPPSEGAPNYLTRFRDFEDVIRSLETRIGLGRTLSERLLRHSLLHELLNNLTFMVQRHRTNAFPRHSYMQRVREEAKISSRELDKPITLSGDTVSRIIFALVGRTRSKQLSIARIEEAISQGIFLKHDATTASFEETAVHKALRQILRDVIGLNKLDEMIVGSTSWDVNILNAAMPERRSFGDTITIMGWDLAGAFGYYDRVENIFNRHIAVCKVLLGIDEDLQPYRLTPITPVGEKMEQSIRAESVSAEEVAYLIRQRISPFGNRIPRETFGENREKQIQSIIKRTRDDFIKAGIDHDILTPDMFKNFAEKFIDEYTVPPEEGIAKIDRN